MPSWPSTASRSWTSWAVWTSGPAELTLRPPPAAGSGFRPALGGTPGVRDLGVAASAVDGQLGRQRGGRQAGPGFQRRADARINGGDQERHRRLDAVLRGAIGLQAVALALALDRPSAVTRLAYVDRVVGPDDAARRRASLVLHPVAGRRYVRIRQRVP